MVVAAPPSVLEQWKAELEDRFGLTFEILDRAYVSRMRRERGFGVNPWRTHSRFLVSHNLLIDTAYADPLREWLGERGEHEARQLTETLTAQSQRVLEEIDRHDATFRQLTLGFRDEDTRQLEADMRHWQRRREQFDRDLEGEPQRIRAFHEVRARRVEPVGLVYLWPETN